MRLNKFYKEIQDSVSAVQSRTPVFKPRSEKEMEEIIHKNRVLERKRQIALIKDELIENSPTTLSYNNPVRRINTLELVVKLIGGLPKQFKP